MKILITDFHNSSNRGDAAIVEGMLNSLNKEFENPEITFLTEDPKTLNKINVCNGIKNKLMPFSWRRIEIKLTFYFLIYILKYFSSKNIIKKNL